MKPRGKSRRNFLKAAGLCAGAALFPDGISSARAQMASANPDSVDYTLRIATSPIELAPDHIISVTNYNGQFPGPLLRFKEGQPVTVEIHNDTDTPEQLHWHGQMVSTDVDGAAEEGTPYIPAHGMRRITFTPQSRRVSASITPTIARAPISHAGQYSGQVGPVYIEPKHEPGQLRQRDLSCAQGI